MEEKDKNERIFELRSEKVRSIVGEIPSSFVRYGIFVIVFALIVLFIVTYYLPYKQVYFGNATLYTLSSEPLDSIETIILLKFNDKRPSIQKMKNVPIIFKSSTESIHGTLLYISSKRDTIGRQKAICRIPYRISADMENSEVDFIVTIHSGTLLDHLFSGLFRE